MDIRKDYQHAIAQRDKEWWCRQKDDARESGLKHIAGVRSQTIEWRIGWAMTVCQIAEQEVLDFLASFSDSWECGKKAGAKHAWRGDCNSTDRERFPDYRVISFRHAAWLLGWLKGFKKVCKGPVPKPRRGSKNGRAAAKIYGYLLVVHRNCWPSGR